MPRSRSRSLLSITRSATRSLARNVPLWCSSASTSVVLPWSTWAMMATLRQQRVGDAGRGLRGGRHLSSIRASKGHMTVCRFVPCASARYTGNVPIYEYDCRECGTRFEVIVQGRTTPECPACHGTNLERALSTFAVSSNGRNRGAIRSRSVRDMWGPARSRCVFPELVTDRHETLAATTRVADDTDLR